MDLMSWKVQGLGDLELAVLLCLVAEQHCIVSSETSILNELTRELQLVASKVFGLSCAVVDCSATTTLDDFREAVLVDAAIDDEDSDVNHEKRMSVNPSGHVFFRQSVFRQESGISNSLDERRIASIVIAKNLNLASRNVQTQALELIRTKRVYTHTALHGTSKDFLFIALQSSETGPKLDSQLNDFFGFSHAHYAEDGFPNVEEEGLGRSSLNDTGSISSAFQKKKMGQLSGTQASVMTPAELKQLRASAARTRMSAEVSAYLHNIVIFMRLHRYVAGGVSALATRQMRAVVKALAPLHGLSFVPPSLVALAVRKVYPHRLILATTKNERSLQWGSSIEAVEEVLDQITIDDALDAVISSVEAPL